MNQILHTRLAQLAAIVLALFASSAVAAGLAQTAEATRPQVALVIAGSAADQPSVVAQARAAVAAANRSSDAQLRVVHTTADQLGVTRMLAARGYGTIVTVGVDRRVAIAPVAARYPHTRFVEAGQGGFEPVLRTGV